MIRIFVAHNAIVSDELFELVRGNLTTTKVKALVSAERTERLGPESFLRKAVAGKFTTFHFTTAITNLRLDARYWAIAPSGGETAQNMHVRQIRSQLFNNEATRIQNMYTQAYHTSRDDTQMKRNALRGNSSEVVDWLRRIAHYDKVIANPPRSEVGVATLVTREQMLAAKILALKDRTHAERISIWRSVFFNGDVMASLFAGTRGIVDVRRLIFNGDPETVRLSTDDDAVVNRAQADQSRYRDIWYNALPQLCDALYLNIIGAECLVDWLEHVCSRYVWYFANHY
jgi:hypothetical protein